MWVSESKEPGANRASQGLAGPRRPPVGAQSPVHTAAGNPVTGCQADFLAAATRGSCSEATLHSGSGRSVLVCEEEGSTALPTPAAPPMLASQGGVRALSPPRGPGIAAGPYLQTEFGVRKIPKNVTVTLDHFLECVTPSCPQVCGRMCPHTPTRPLAHSAFLRQCVLRKASERSCPVLGG